MHPPWSSRPSRRAPRSTRTLARSSRGARAGDSPPRVATSSFARHARRSAFAGEAGAMKAAVAGAGEPHRARWWSSASPRARPSPPQGPGALEQVRGQALAGVGTCERPRSWSRATSRTRTRWRICAPRFAASSSSLVRARAPARLDRARARLDEYRSWRTAARSSSSPRSDHGASMLARAEGAGGRRDLIRESCTVGRAGLARPWAARRRTTS